MIIKYYRVYINLQYINLGGLTLGPAGPEPFWDLSWDRAPSVPLCVLRFPQGAAKRAPFIF